MPTDLDRLLARVDAAEAEAEQSAREARAALRQRDIDREHYCETLERVEGERDRLRGALRNLVAAVDPSLLAISRTSRAEHDRVETALDQAKAVLADLSTGPEAVTSALTDQQLGSQEEGEKT